MKTEPVAKRLRSLYKGAGYTPYKMRKFEEYDLYLHNKNFLSSTQIITFTEPSGKLVALRPDVTLSIVKNSRGAERVYYTENVYRADKDAGAFREITQVGLECVGEIDAYCKLEVLDLACRSLAAISEEYVLDVSHLGILSSVLDGMTEDGAVRAKLLSATGEKNLHGVKEICAEAGIDPTPLCTLIEACGAPAEVWPKLATLALSADGQAARAELTAVLTALGEGHVRVDFSVVNDMSYYTGIVFRGFVPNTPAGVLSGGQYDLLLSKMGKEGGAIGFAVYPDLLPEPPAGGTDADILLLYKEGDDPAAVYAAARAWRGEGMRVAVRRTVPAKMTFGKVLVFGEV